MTVAGAVGGDRYPAGAGVAGELADGPEREMLRETARATADELGLTWLRGVLPNR